MSGIFQGGTPNINFGTRLLAMALATIYVFAMSLILSFYPAERTRISNIITLPATPRSIWQAETRQVIFTISNTAPSNPHFLLTAKLSAVYAALSAWRFL